LYGTAVVFTIAWADLVRAVCELFHLWDAVGGLLGLYGRGGSVYIPRGFNSDVGDNNFRGAGECGGIGG
jgi:hypothetical protein